MINQIEHHYMIISHLDILFYRAHVHIPLFAYYLSVVVYIL